mgnify:CR=1 FL=1|jgi:hypothetical protein
MATNNASTSDERQEPEKQLSKDQAWQITGGLSKTTKMPCLSWSIPASHCHTGKTLAPEKDSVCHGCYARKGNYAWPRVRQATEKRLAKTTHPDWEEAMAALIHWQANKNNQPFFRWFDSGDLQSRRMLEQIVAVVTATPDVQHWLPTKEHGLVRAFLKHEELPENLTLRLSAHYVDAEPPTLDLPTSTVHRYQPAIGYACPAYERQQPACGACRACWDPGVANVSYRYH